MKKIEIGKNKIKHIGVNHYQSGYLHLKAIDSKGNEINYCGFKSRDGLPSGVFGDNEELIVKLLDAMKTIDEAINDYQDKIKNGKL